jgi:hypothetical protein
MKTQKGRKRRAMVGVKQGCTKSLNGESKKEVSLRSNAPVGLGRKVVAMCLHDLNISYFADQKPPDWEVRSETDL